MVLVEDEWEREMEADDDLDLLFVKYNTQQVPVEHMQDTIAGFDIQAVKSKE